MIRLLALALLVGCGGADDDALPTPEPTRIVLPEPRVTPPPRSPQPVVTPDILLRDVAPAHEFDPEPLGDLKPLLPGRWRLLPDARKLRQLERAKELMANKPDMPEARQIVAALDTVMSMELVVKDGRLRFTMPVAQAAHPYSVTRDDDPELDVQLHGPNNRKEDLYFVFEARDRLVLTRGRESLRFERL